VGKARGEGPKAGRKVRVAEAIPPDLLEFLRDVAAEMRSSDEDSPAMNESNDLLRAEHCSGGLVDAERQVFHFKYFPKGGPWHWDFEVTASEILDVVSREGGTLSLYRCSDKACGHRWPGPAARCPQCDLGEPLPATTPVSQGPVGPAGRPRGTRLSPEGEAARFLTLLLERGSVELADGVDAATLARSFAPLLVAAGPTDAKAERIINWLVEHEKIEEVFLRDEELAKLLEKW